MLTYTLQNSTEGEIFTEWRLLEVEFEPRSVSNALLFLFL